MKSVQQVLEHVDPYAADQLDSFGEAMSIARHSRPVLHSDVYGGFHFVTRYADVRSVCEQPELFISRDPATIGPLPIRMIPLDADLPDHRFYRHLLNPYFSQSYVRRYAAGLETIAHRLIDGFVDRGRIEVVDEYAMPFTSQALAAVVFATTDEDLVRRAVPVVERIGAADQTEADQLNLAAVAQEALAQAEREGADRDDVLAALVRAGEGGRVLTAEERLGIIITLFAGGLDTTKGMLTGILHFIATTDGLEDRLRKGDWSRDLLEEFLRLETTVPFMARTATADAMIGDAPVRAGDRVVISFASANRDEERFEAADTLHLDGSGPAHAAFGLGIHRCLGMHFARLQLQIAIDVLLARVHDIQLAPDQVVTREMGQSSRIPRLEITFSALDEASR